MIRLDLFRALQPSTDYFRSPLRLELAGVGYDRILHSIVADQLANLMGAHGPFQQLKKFSDSMGIEALRNDPNLADSVDSAACAHSEQHVDVSMEQQIYGYVLQQSIGNRQVASALAKLVVEGDPMPPELGVWAMENFCLLETCGGFEVARVLIFDSPHQRNLVHKQVNGYIAVDEAKADRNTGTTNLQLFRNILCELDARPSGDLH